VRSQLRIRWSCYRKCHNNNRSKDFRVSWGIRIRISSFNCINNSHRSSWGISSNSTFRNGIINNSYGSSWGISSNSTFRNGIRNNSYRNNVSEWIRPSIFTSNNNVNGNSFRNGINNSSYRNNVNEWINIRIFTSNGRNCSYRSNGNFRIVSKT